MNSWNAMLQVVEILPQLVKDPFTVQGREIKFIGLFGDKGHWGPYNPYKPCNHNLIIGIIIFPHIDNLQSTGYN